MQGVLERFLRYVKIDTTSREGSDITPSYKGEWELAKLLKEEMTELGLSKVLLDDNCYVYGCLPANCPSQPVIALIAHMDTVDAVPGRHFAPRVVEYTGDPIVLNRDADIILSAVDFPYLHRWQGESLVVTDGTTVLGADDKAGAAEIMGAMAHLSTHPEIKHGEIWVIFTPDEEIGSGADLLQLNYVNCDYAYTVDGGDLSEISYENFNAASAVVTVKGRNIHPGYAKNKMMNAAKMAMQFHAMLPANEAPEHTEGYEGFFHLTHLEGDEENASLRYIVRDHDVRKFEQRKQTLSSITDYLNQRCGKTLFDLAIRDSYRNMLEILDKCPDVIDRAKRALEVCGLTPKAIPIRGGTDGARLSFRGLPCPNIGTGGENAHSVYEYVPVSALNKATEILVELVRAKD
ncbi:MAG: peptidase T [Eubacteriales bacterium]|nr:peptidase T [Eubacteriales bacterium]